ncbi:MAG TPA: hypothetical protein VM261_08970 [Kofleriaceae bacterium]|nr:hypothetical protein [Kofleriaceae bacterium]
MIGLGLALGAHSADAKAKKKKPPAKVVKKEEKVAPPNAEQKKALGELMGSFKFGMTKDEVITQLTKSIDERYADQIKATNDVYTQDKLRKEKNKEVTRIRQSYAEFTGKKTGWDVSVVDSEFAHNTEESMLVYWENQGGKNQRRFFFFQGGELWKMFIAIDTKSLADDQRNFGFFRGLMEARYGKGATIEGRAVWKVPEFEVHAVDKMAFYGAFGLLIQNPAKLKAIAELRTANAPAKKDKDALIEVIRDKPDDKVNLDENKDAVDAIISGGK